MTITEHLEFSVLTAPLALVDRRALSQAWYSALYPQTAPAGGRSASPAASVAAVQAPHHELSLQAKRAPRESVQAPITSKPSGAMSSGMPQTERRALRSPLARKIERVFLRPRNARKNATFSLEGSGGRVQIVLQQHGSRVQLIAICPAKAQPDVARALAQARYALAVRGIALEASALEASC